MAYIYALSDTWNAAGTTFTGLGLNVTDTASAAGSLLMDLQVGGASRFNVTKAGAGIFSSSVEGGGSTLSSAGVNLSNARSVNFSGTLAGTVNWGDLFLARDAANTLAQRNGTNPQALRVYNTFTDASNYERGVMAWSGNDLKIGTEGAGTGVSTRQTHLYGGQVRFYTNGTHRWNFSANGDILAAADNTYDIGASGATRPRNLYMGSWIRMATTTVASLPAAATAGAGARMFVTDASAPVFGSAVVGGGAVTVPVYSTGSAWNVG